MATRMMGGIRIRVSPPFHFVRSPSKRNRCIGTGVREEVAKARREGHVTRDVVIRIFTKMAKSCK